jgi:hypothetical protein
MIYDRWAKLWAQVQAKTPPARDYAIQYPREKLELMAKRGKLNKEETKKVEAGRPVDKGDFQCRFCQFRTHCWADSPKV